MLILRVLDLLLFGDSSLLLDYNGLDITSWAFLFETEELLGDDKFF